jgi:histone deacetylase 1/2
MDNANSPEYLEKIKIQVIENLKKTTFAPSVQMQDVPREPLGGMTEEEEAELDDMDEDDNKDTRHTERRWDKAITGDDEFDESEDEEESKANGVRPQNGTLKRRNIMDYQNPNAAASDVEMDSRVGTPDATNEVQDATTALATQANAEVNAEIMEKKQLDPAALSGAEAGPSNAPSCSDSVRQAVVDGDGDVSMADSATAAVEVAPPAETNANVATPPLSPATVPAAASLLPAAVEEPTASAQDGEKMETDAVSPVIEAKLEGEAEREAEDVTAEASTEIAEQSQP